jgi:hypothetical protein
MMHNNEEIFSKLHLNDEITKDFDKNQNPFALGSGDNQEFYYRLDEDEEIKQ